MDPLAPLSLAISLSGVAMIVFVVWLANRRPPARKLGDEAAVRARIRLELPTFAIGQVEVDPQDERAIASSVDGKEVVLQFEVGARPTSWRMAVDKLRKIELQPAAEGKVLVKIQTGEFTMPLFTLGPVDAARGAALFPGLSK